MISQYFNRLYSDGVEWMGRSGRSLGDQWGGPALL
jgi:hypothetical protein